MDSLRYVCLSACFFLCVISSKAQNYFNIDKLVDVDSINNTGWGYSIIDTEKDTITLNIIGASGVTSYVKSFNYKLYNDTSINLLKRIDGTLNRVEFYSIPGSLIRINDSIIALGCNYVHYDSSFNQDTIKSGLIYFNKNGDTLYSRWFGESLKFIIRGFETIDSSIFLLGQTKIIGDGSKAHIVKTDLMGNLIWEKTLTSLTSFGGGAVGISEIINSGYLVSGVFNYHDVGSTHYGDCGIYRLDLNGNILWYKKLFSNYYGGRFRVHDDKAGNYFLSGNLDTIINVNDFPHNGYIAKIDSNANVIWTHVFNEIPHILKNMWQYQVLANGDLIFCGERLEAIGNNIHLGWICRMDSSGQIKWEHYYKQTDSSDYNHLAEIKQMPDGGFIATGTCRDSLTKKQAVWLIRTDSNGCLIPGCVAPNSIEVFPDDKAAFAVYPNPTNGELILESKGMLNKKIEISLYNLTGQKILSVMSTGYSEKVMIDIRHFPSGMYFLKADHFTSKILKE